MMVTYIKIEEKSNEWNDRVGRELKSVRVRG